MRLTDAQLAALHAFARDNGRRWKSALRHAWETGDWSRDFGDNACWLQQVRNAFGPSWLVRFRLDDARTHERRD